MNAESVLQIPAIKRHIANCHVAAKQPTPASFTKADLFYVHPSALTHMYMNDELSVEEFEQAIDARLRLGA